MTAARVLIETYDTGGQTMPLSMVVCQPERAVTADRLTEQMPAADGLNVPFIAGTLSAFLAHERGGAALYQVAIEHSDTPMLVGGDPHYVSPAARMAEQLAAKLLEGPVLLAGSVDLLTLETAFLEAVIVAEHKCHDNWTLLSHLGEALPDGNARRLVRDAVATVEPQEDGHVRWATKTFVELALANAQQPVTSGLMGVVERAAHKVKDALM
jgi:hypothetical protein